MKILLEKAIEARLFTPLDVQFARYLINDNNPLRLFVVALLSAETLSGHVCLPLNKITQTELFSGRHAELAESIWQSLDRPDEETIYQQLLQCDAISLADSKTISPLVLSGRTLYLQRMWQNEQRVAHYFSRGELFTDPLKKISGILNELFPETDTINWQKVAAAIAVTSQIAVISGGPGTGKTTTVARILAAIIKLQMPEDVDLKIALAAPTGKAAARLTESLGSALAKISLTPTERAMLPQQAQTLHRLLGAQPESQKLRYHRNNPLMLDVLIVDEASMVDLPMMAKLIEALPEKARVIFLGDKDQLASVEAGAVLGDICRYANLGYSPSRAAQLNELTGYSLADFTSELGPVIRESLCLLRKSYRFAEHSGIGKLAFAVNTGNVRAVDKLLKSELSDVDHYPLESEEDYGNILLSALAGYQPYLQSIRDRKAPEIILAQYNQYRMLAALREGPYGISGLNERLEQLFHRQGLIRRPINKHNKYYEGRPIMISRNDSPLGLFNGDIGILLKDEDGQLRAYFQLPDGTIKGIQPNRLPQHDTAFVMTVHKSQGSEFDHTVLVLPKVYSPVISRELVYTAMTRAKEKLTIYAEPWIIRKAIETPTQRRSGLEEQFKICANIL
nr:exodeoxyribonuclease V subunit alpha [uncultured Moellerella sp.]